MSVFESPVPLSELESVLAWVDTFKLSRATKKINRDFSDAVLLAEMLAIHYPKLVEMHNYPPRNSHSLKLNNWMTLNRKVLKKLKLGLCLNTMEQLANCAPGFIERVLIMVRDKIRRDEEASKAAKEDNTGLSSGGSYYEACGDDEHVLIVPVKTRVNGILETLQQKVVSHESYCALKEELKDAKEATEVLRQKVEHLDSLLKLKDERIDELQSQLERKQARRKEVETQQTVYTFPSETILSPHLSNDSIVNTLIKVPSIKSVDSKTKEEDNKIKVDEAKIIGEDFNTRTVECKDETEDKIEVEEHKLKSVESKLKLIEYYNNADESKLKIEDKDLKVVTSKTKFEESRIPVLKDSLKSLPKASCSDIYRDPLSDTCLTNVRSDVFKDADVIIDDKFDLTPDIDEFKDSEPGIVVNFNNTGKLDFQIDGAISGVN